MSPKPTGSPFRSLPLFPRDFFYPLIQGCLCLPSGANTAYPLNAPLVASPASCSTGR